MTDNDVIKWWREIIELCNECHPDSFKNVLSKDIANATLDLINRQKAEIERLKADAEMAEGYADALEERAKAEAIKEFAMRLKALLRRNAHTSPLGWNLNDVIIDNLVKEMVGDDNG